MKLKQILGMIILIAVTTFLIGFGVVTAYTGFNYNGNGQSTTNENSGSCSTYTDKYNLCTASGKFLVVRMTIQYYNATTGNMEPVDGTRPYFVVYNWGNNWHFLRSSNCKDKENYTDATHGNYSSSNCEIRSSWFNVDDTNNKYGYNATKMIKDTTYTRHGGEASEAQMEKWFVGMGTSYGKLGQWLNNKGYSNCAVDSNHSGNCFKKSGLRVILEPVIQYHKPGTDNTMHFNTIKGLAMELEENNKSLDDGWQTIGSYGGLYTLFNDVGVKIGSTSSSPSEETTRKCLANVTYSNDDLECGYGYNIIDPGWDFTEYNCEYKSGNKCNIIKSTNGETDATYEVSCNSYSTSGSKYNGNTLTKVCPTVTYQCKNVKDTGSKYTDTTTNNKCNVSRIVKQGNTLVSSEVLNSSPINCQSGGLSSNNSSPIDHFTADSTNASLTPACPTSPVKEIDKNFVKKGEQFTYTVSQLINSKEDETYTSFEFKDVLEAPLQADSFKVTVDNGTTNLCDSLFTCSISSDKKTVTATLKDPSSNDFYGTKTSGNVTSKKYKFSITGKFRDDAYSNSTNSKYSSYYSENGKGTTVYEVPNTATIDTNLWTKTTNEVLIHTYYEPSDPIKTVNLKYVNDITTFEYRVSQYIPALKTFKDLNGNTVKPTYTSFVLKDTLGEASGHSDAFDMDKVSVRVISTQYGGDKDLSSGDNKYFDVTIDKNTKTVTATATSEALANEDFYGYTYEMIIAAKIKEEAFKDSGEGAYTVVNNVATRTLTPTHDASFVMEKKTNTVPTTHVNPTNPTKAIKDLAANEDKLVRAEKDYQYIINDKVQPATEDNYYDSYVFTDVLEPPLQIKSTDDVKITQIDASGNKKDYTSNFDIQINGNTITASAKSEVLKNADFYGTRGSNDEEILKTYEFELNVSLRNKAEDNYDMSKYVSEDGLRYVIPNKAKITTKTPGNNPTDRETNEVNVYYYPEPNPIKGVSEENITDLYLANKEYTYTITKRVLAYDKELWYESFEFRDTLEDCLEANSNLVVKNEAGVVITKWFDVKVNGQTISATLKKDNNNENFYGHTYSFIITTKVKQKYDLTKWRQGNQYIIPNEASFIYDGKAIDKTNKREVYINHQALAVPKTSANIPPYIIVLGILLLGGAGAGGYYVYNGKKFVPLKEGLKKMFRK